MSDGEAWTRELLGRLRAAGYRPAAWRSFVASSLARSREQRRERRAEHRVTLALAVGGAIGWGLALAAGRPALAAAGAGWWLLEALMVDWHLGMLERPDGERLSGIGRANLVTMLRGGLPPAVLALAGTTAGVVLLAVAGAADVVDGRLARRRNEISRLGIWLDSSVDTTILGGAVVGAALRRLLPGWVVALVLLRLVVPWVLTAAAYFVRAERPRRSGFETNRAPGIAAGAALFAGLALAYMRLPGAAELGALGAVSGLVAFALSVRRTVAPAAPERPPRRDVTAKAEQPAREIVELLI